VACKQVLPSRRKEGGGVGGVRVEVSPLQVPKYSSSAVGGGEWRR